MSKEEEDDDARMDDDMAAEVTSNVALSNVSQVGSTSYIDDMEEDGALKDDNIEYMNDDDDEDDDENFDDESPGLVEDGENSDDDDDDDDDEDENADDEEENMIAQMSQITGLDWDESRMFLEMSDWDLSQAAEIFYSEQKDQVMQSSSERESSPEALGQDQNGEEEQVSSSVVRKAFGAVRRFLSAQIGATGREAAMRFVHEYELNYSTGPSFCVDSYKNAARLALNRSKALLVLLKSSMHQDTDEFCKKVLGSRELNQYLNQNFVVWGADVSGIDGYFLMNALGVARLPFLAVLVCRPGAEELVERIQGILDPTEIQAILDRATGRYRSRLESSRRQEEARQRDRALRQEQDQEFQASLEADRAKARAEEEVRQRQLRIQAEHDEIQRRKNEHISNARLRLGKPPAQGEPAARLRLQFPNGAKVDRKFFPHHTLAHLRDFVQLHVHDNDIDLQSFAFATNYPRRVFNFQNEDIDIPLSELSGKVIYVHDLDA